MLAAYPVLIWLARRHHVWDPLHDLGFAALCTGLGAGAVWLHWPRIAGLLALSS
jgi:hypothetical protein